MFLLYSHRESNPDLRFRRALFYPLNYENASPLTLFDSCMYLAYSMLVHQSIDKARNGLGCIY